MATIPVWKWTNVQKDGMAWKPGCELPFCNCNGVHKLLYYGTVEEVRQPQGGPQCVVCTCTNNSNSSEDCRFPHCQTRMQISRDAESMFSCVADRTSIRPVSRQTIKSAALTSRMARLYRGRTSFCQVDAKSNMQNSLAIVKYVCLF